MGSWRVGIGPCSSVLAGVNGVQCRLSENLLRSRNPFKKAPFFYASSAPGRRLPPLQKPGK